MTTLLSGLPGQELWQPYLEAAPQSAEAFAQDPLGALLSLLPVHPVQLLTQIAHSYIAVFLFLLAVLLLSFLLGFLPVYGGVLTAGGEVQAGMAACGLLLSGLCLLAQCTALWVGPLLQSYLAISMACCISTQKGLADGCRSAGRLLQKGLSLAGRLFAILLGLQRVVTLQLDKTTLQVGRFLTGSVPVIGDALSGAADAVLAGMQLLKSTLGLAGIALLGAEFLPLYLTLLVHLALLYGCVLLCDLAENRRCKALFSCLAEAVRCMAAVTALFFGLMAVGVAALMLSGG